MISERQIICVMDGQGGGIGSAIIKKLKERFGENNEIIALGTNAIATAQMLKAKANKGATGSNAIVQSVKKADIIIGPIGIIMPNAMMGELTPLMAQAISQAEAKKFLLPLTQENIKLVGTVTLPLPQLIDELIDKHLKFPIGA